MARSNVLQTSFRTLISCVCGIVVGVLLVHVVQILVGSKHIKCVLWHYHYPVQAAHESYKCRNGVRSVHDRFLFVGIMTARKFLNTRALASSKTWGLKVPGQVVYFMEEGEKYKGGLNVVQLEDVNENDYPPQKKSFAMIHYISRHYAQDYEWIVRADDDLYIKVDELVTFLKSIDHRRLLYLGQPGFGKSSEKGKLGLNGAYCMGGPGVVMTSRLVKALSPHLRDCLNATITEHEDTELGRCIYQYLNIVCTSAFEMSSKFYQNYAESWDKYSSFKKDLGKSEEYALTLHPIKESSYVFKVDNFFSHRTIEKLKVKELNLLAEITSIDLLTQKDKKNGPVTAINISIPIIRTYLKQKWTPTTKERLKYDDIFFQKNTSYNDVWDMMVWQSLYSVSLGTGMLVTSSASKVGRVLLHWNTLNKLQTSLNNERYQMKFLNVTYQCLTPAQGVELMIFVRTWVIMDITIPMHVRRHFTQNLVEFRESYNDKSENQNSTIHVLVEIFKRSSHFGDFLRQHKKAVKEYHGNVVLKVVVFLDDAEEHKIVSALTEAMVTNNSDLAITVTYVNETFLSGRGMVLAMDALCDTSLLLLLDVDMEYTSDFLHRVSKNTVLDHMVYFPVVYNLFSPNVICYLQDTCDYDTTNRQDEMGIWRSDEFIVSSMYKRDLRRTGQFISQMQGWKWQGIDLYERFLKSGVTVIRSADPGVIYRTENNTCV